MMKLKNGQKGFTMVEILAVMAISGILLTGLVVAIFQVFGTTRQNSVPLTALENVKNSAYRLSQDVRKASTTNLVDGGPAVSNLTLDWTIWYATDDNTYDANGNLIPKGNLIPSGQYHRCEYSLSGVKLQRKYGILRTADSGTINTLTDNALAQADDYWNGFWLEIVNTTDGLAPKGEIRQVTDFVATTDTLHTTPSNFSAAIGAGDTYMLYKTTNISNYISSIQFSRQGSTADYTITVTVTASPEGKPATAEQKTYYLYLKSKVGAVQ